MTKWKGKRQTFNETPSIFTPNPLSGFACLADHSRLNLFGLPDVAVQIMSAMMRAGVGKVASVCPSESFARIVVTSAGEQTGDSYTAKTKFFTDLGSAEAWLDK